MNTACQCLKSIALSGNVTLRFKELKERGERSFHG
jgi:hypothetical protein